MRFFNKSWKSALIFRSRSSGKRNAPSWARIRRSRQNKATRFVDMMGIRAHLPAGRSIVVIVVAVSASCGNKAPRLADGRSSLYRRPPEWTLRRWRYSDEAMVKIHRGQRREGRIPKVLRWSRHCLLPIHVARLPSQTGISAPESLISSDID